MSLLPHMMSFVLSIRIPKEMEDPLDVLGYVGGGLCSMKRTQSKIDLRKDHWHAVLSGQDLGGELQSLIKFLKVAPFDDLGVWKEQIARPMGQGREGVAIERLRVVLGAIMLRRTKDVLRSDGDKLEAAGGENKMKMVKRKVESVVTEFDEKEKEFYEKLEARTEENLEKMLSGFGVGRGLGGVNMTSALLLLLRLRQGMFSPTRVNIS
jgi:hypothetical protein